MGKPGGRSNDTYCTIFEQVRGKAARNKYVLQLHWVYLLGPWRVKSHWPCAILCQLQAEMGWLEHRKLLHLCHTVPVFFFFILFDVALFRTHMCHFCPYKPVHFRHYTMHFLLNKGRALNSESQITHKQLCPNVTLNQCPLPHCISVAI